MGGSDASRASHLAQQFAAPYGLAHLRVKAGKVGVISTNSTAMIDDDEPSVTAVPPRKHDDAVGGSPDWRAGRRSDVDALMKFPFAREGIGAFSERGHQCALHRPQVRYGCD